MKLRANKSNKTTQSRNPSVGATARFITTINAVFSFFAIMTFSLAKAGDYVEECNSCVATPHASLIAQAKGHDLNDGSHTVFVVNMNSVNAWKFTIYVVDNNSGGPFNLGEKDVFVMMSEEASQADLDALTSLKDAGLTSIKFNVTIAIDVDPAECPSASGGLCAELTAMLQGRSETLAWAAGYGTFTNAWNALKQWIFGTVGPKLRYIVIYPDGSMEIYVFFSQGQGTGFEVLENSRVLANGLAPAGGSLAGWTSFGNGPGVTILGFGISGGSAGGGSACRTVSITVSGTNSVTEVTTSNTC